MTEYMKGQWIEYPGRAPTRAGNFTVQLLNGRVTELTWMYHGSYWDTPMDSDMTVVRFFDEDSVKLPVPPPPAIEPEIEVADLAPFAELDVYNVSELDEVYNEAHKQAMRSQIKEHRAQVSELHDAFIGLLKFMREQELATLRGIDEPSKYDVFALRDKINDILRRAGVIGPRDDDEG